MNPDRYLQDCSQLHAADAGRRWLCRLLRPTLGKKFLLIFAILALTAVANWLAVEAALAKLHGIGGLVNVSGSLRWLSQRVQLDVARVVHGDSSDRRPVDAHLLRLDEAMRLLETGGRAQGIAVTGLPEGFAGDIAALRLAVAGLRRQAGLALADAARGVDARGHLDALHGEGTRLFDTADTLAAALTREAEEAESRTLAILLRLGLLDLSIFVAVLLLVRLRVVHPLRRLAALSRAFAEGQHGLRSGFRSRDEIGQLAVAFDAMAATIEGDLRQLAGNAAELARREQRLRKFALVTEQAPISVVITDVAGTIEYVNPKFSEITGYAAAEVLGRSPSLLKSGETPPQVFAEMWLCLRAGREWRGELRNRKKNGELFWEDTRIAPLKDDAGRITHFVAVKEDITARKQAEAERLGLNAELERRVAERTRQLTESNRELEAFSYSIAHDLRAPLRGINGFASLMEENCQDCGKGESLEYMGRIRRASLRMGSLMDDLLDLSRMARSEIRREALDLGAMARSVLDELAAAAPSRAVQVEIGAGLLASGDATLLRDVLENLLGNAWKFSAQRDPAHIAFGCRADAPDGETVFYVRDDGAGFDMRYADKLFGAFQRLHTTQEFAGNGIGLAMVRRIIGLHGGRVWAESAPDEGATFYFTLDGPPRPAAGHG